MNLSGDTVKMPEYYLMHIHSPEKLPLRLASSFDCSWDFTLYREGFMALNPSTKRVEYISVDRQINQPPLDTDYVSIVNMSLM